MEFYVLEFQDLDGNFKGFLNGQGEIISYPYGFMLRHKAEQSGKGFFERADTVGRCILHRIRLNEWTRQQSWKISPGDDEVDHA